MLALSLVFLILLLASYRKFIKGREVDVVLFTAVIILFASIFISKILSSSLQSYNDESIEDVTPKIGSGTIVYMTTEYDRKYIIDEGEKSNAHFFYFVDSKGKKIDSVGMIETGLDYKTMACGSIVDISFNNAPFSIKKHWTECSISNWLVFGKGKCLKDAVLKITIPKSMIVEIKENEFISSNWRFR